MSPTRRSLIAMTTTLIACKSAFAQNATDNTNDIEFLDDDPSRASLFREYIEIPAENALSQPGNAFALPKSFLFPKHTRKDDKGKDRDNQHFGVDISHHNGVDIDFSVFKSVNNIAFCYVKAGQGSRQDKRFPANWSALGSLNSDKAIYRGAYFFLSSSSSGANQGRVFAKILGKLRPTDMPPVLDLEWDVVPGNADLWRGRRPSDIIDQTISCLETIEKETGRRPMVYTAGSWLQERIGSHEQISRLMPYNIWIADYSKSSLGKEVPRSTGLKQVLWQFTDRSQLDSGYEATMDASVFHGTAADFRETFHVEAI